MAIANLDYEDLNILLTTYEKRRVELKQTIDKLKDIRSTTNSLGLRVGKDFLEKTTYVNQKDVENDLEAFDKELGKVIDKVIYIKGLIDEETSNPPFTIGQL